ncbi:MAG: hypothetical protein ABEJ27_05020 [Halodesulfurarchaeum sp.]
MKNGIGTSTPQILGFRHLPGPPCIGKEIGTVERDGDLAGESELIEMKDYTVEISDRSWPAICITEDFTVFSVKTRLDLTRHRAVANSLSTVETIRRLGLG